MSLPTLPSRDPIPVEKAFLGWDPADRYRRCWSKPEDSVGIVGPPRYGKTPG